MRRVQHRNLCQHHLYLFVHRKCIFNPASHVLLYFIRHYYTHRSLFNLLSVRSRSVKSILATVWPVTRAALSAAPSSLHPLHTSLLALISSSFSLAPPATLLSHPQSQPEWRSPGSGPSSTSCGMAFIYQSHNWGQENPCCWGPNYMSSDWIKSQLQTEFVRDRL